MRAERGSLSAVVRKGRPGPVLEARDFRRAFTRFQKDQATGWHRHEHDYVIVPLMDGKLKIVTKDGDSIAEMKKGAPYFREEGVEHDVVNATDGEYAFIEIELK